MSLFLSQKDYCFTAVLATRKISFDWVTFPKPKHISAVLGSEFGMLVGDSPCVKGLAKRLAFPVSMIESLVE